MVEGEVAEAELGSVLGEARMCLLANGEEVKDCRRPHHGMEGEEAGDTERYHGERATCTLDHRAVRALRSRLGSRSIASITTTGLQSSDLYYMPKTKT